MNISGELSLKQLEQLKIADAATYKLLIEQQKTDQTDDQKTMSFNSLKMRDEETAEEQNFADIVLKNSDPVIVP